ncbi:MAG: hypothetical protein ABI358_00560 [Ginsengibacter sp.]
MFFFYWGEIQLCKIRAREYADFDFIMPGKTMVVFSSDNKAIQFVNKNEIRVDGKLYDIKKTELNNGITIYYAMSDEEEDHYVQSLQGWEDTNSREKSLPGKTINLHLAKFLKSEKNCHFNLHSLDINKQKLKEMDESFFYNSPLKIVFTPPPEKFFS